VEKWFKSGAGDSELALTTVLLVSTLLSEPGLANRLEQVAMRSSSMLMTVGQATSVIGILLGGIFMSLGMGQIGKMILVSALLGAACVFGGPAIIEFIRTMVQ
jgi:hypothetical protein